MNQKIERVRFGFDGSQIRQRAKALAAFEDWERRRYGSLAHPNPGQAIQLIGEMITLLPEASRQRPVDASGVQQLHKVLSKMPGLGD